MREACKECGIGHSMLLQWLKQQSRTHCAWNLTSPGLDEGRIGFLIDVSDTLLAYNTGVPVFI